MRTMSWSRYHTFTRIPTHLRRRAAKRMRHAAKTTLGETTLEETAPEKPATQKAAARAAAAGPEPERRSGDLSGRFPARIFQSLMRIFRTRRLRNRTDI